MNGSCLRCRPNIMEGVRRGGLQASKMRPQAAYPEAEEYDAVGTELTCADDDMTVASELTMDPFLTAPPPMIDNRYPGGRGSFSGGGNSTGGQYSHGGQHHQRYTSSTSRPNLMQSQFESVSEETPVTEFGRHAQDAAGRMYNLKQQRIDRERDIVREEEGVEDEDDTRLTRHRLQGNIQHLRKNRGARGGGRIEEEESWSQEDQDQEEEEEWESHEHLLDHMEQQEHHNFHPLSTNLMNSETSMSLPDSSDQSPTERSRLSSSGNNSRPNNNEFSKSIHAAAMSQEFYPLSADTHLSASEHSLDFNDVFNEDNDDDDAGGGGGISVGSSGGQSSTDSAKIQRLCQGSLNMERQQQERDKVSPIREASPSTSMLRKSSRESGDSNNTGRRLGGRRDQHGGDSRFSLKRLSSSSNVDDKEIIDDNPLPRRNLGGEGGRKQGHKESNRFSLKRLDSKGRNIGGEREGNRFSLTTGDLEKPKKNNNRRSTLEALGEMSPALEREMNASKNWKSMDILRHAAAEANGEDLDAAVDALFGLVDTSEQSKNERVSSRPPTSPRKPLPRITSSSESIGTFDSAAYESLDIENEISMMASRLSRGSSSHEEAALATTIQQRRLSVSSEKNSYRISTIKDIPLIIEAVRRNPDDKRCTERAFQSLFLLATEPGSEGSVARTQILAEGGMETLVSSMWRHLQSSQVLTALFHALWAISAFNGDDENSGEDSIIKIQQCDVLEALLIAIETHAKDLNIQESGCDLITRLTGLLPLDTPEFKSAVAVLSVNIQDAETNTKAYTSMLDALNSLCQLTDANKREFAKAGNDCHSAIIRGLKKSDSPSILETREMACQLFWCVTSDRTAVSLLSLNNDQLLWKQIIDALKSVPRTKPSVHVYSAACGTLANLALEPSNHSKMIDLGVVPMLCEAIYVYDFSVDVNSAACTALANLSASRDIRNTITSQGGIPALFSAMKSTPVNADVQSEAFRALYNQCESSSEGKLAIVADLDIIISSFFQHEGVKYIQQITGSIICRLSSDEKCRASMIQLTGTFDALAKLMKSNTRKKMVQKAACSTLRNLSEEKAVIPVLLSKGFDSLVIDAMDSYSDTEELQENACIFLRNMASSSPEASVEICSGEGIQSIVKAMQTLPTSASLQAATCGALYAVTKGDTHKSLALSAGAVDSIIYLMLVHPNQVKVLENAVNVLARLSDLKKCTKTIAENGGISTVIETMKSNPSSTGLIVSGARFIQNMALANREYANEALGGITPILGCMDEHPHCAKLVEEACKALRCLVLKSEGCKDHVINADGVAVIEKTMLENSASQRWQTLLLDELFQ